MINKESIIFLTDTIGEIYSIEKLNEGFQNTIYKIESWKWTYCLRISKRNTKKHVQYEIDILQCLKDLPVIKLQSIDGKYIFSVKGKVAILYSFIDGIIRENNTPEELNTVGKFLAKFHNQCKNIKYSGVRSELYSLPDRAIKEHQLYIHKMNISYTELLPGIISELRKNILSDLHPSGPIHVDFGPKNTLWKNGELAAVLDFDNAYKGPYILDIWKSIMFFASYEWGFEIWKAKAFFDGYISKRPLNDREKGEIYKAIKYAFLSHIFVDYYMYAKKVTSEKYFEYIIKDLLISYNSFIAKLDSNPDFLYNKNP